MNRTIFVLVVAEAILAMTSPDLYAVEPSADEMAEARSWAAAKFEGRNGAPAPKTRLVVLANNDVVQKNARCGGPLRIADRCYYRGLFCHAVSKVAVKLEQPAKSFHALIGVDANHQTRPGRGSVVFRLIAGGKELFRSSVMKEGMAAIPVDVELSGAEEVLLEVDDAGDGISCDQADWVEARVVLENGDIIWLGDMFMEHAHRARYSSDAPFSFNYAGKSSAELLKSWKCERATRELDECRTQHTLTCTDGETGLEARCVAVEYRDFPTVEWTLFFKNAGKTDTPILSDILALDATFDRYKWPPYDSTEFVLNHNTGSPCTARDYEPFRTVMKPGASKRFAPPGGRPSDSVLPCFNIEWPGEGVIIAVGWPGQWAAEFARDEDVSLRVRAGQELTRFRLHPGEEVGTPLIVLQFWKGDRHRAQNVWRRWMLAHNLPRPGRPLAPQTAACSSHQYGEMINADEDNQKMFIDRYLKHGVKLDYWWMDAGWYVNETGWPNTGTWEVDRKRFPRGLRAISDHAHAKNVKTIVWFEPERVTPGTWLYAKHPEWLLGADGQQKLLNLGSAEAREWLTEHVCNLITEQGIDLYRNDFNMNPLSYWRGNDAEDRQGITEIRYVMGFLEYWDELRCRYPQMLIDTCASGGRRNDVETLRRSVPLLRSDYIIEPDGQQNHTYGIAPWIPFYGTGVNSFDAYCFRSQICPHLTCCYDMRNEEQDFETLRRLYEQWRRISDCYIGDFYPLTSYSAEKDVWMAWQFNLPEAGKGMVQAFRREDCIYEAARLRLRGLDPEARYEVVDVDIGEASVLSGRELEQDGLPIRISGQPGAALLLYRKEGPPQGAEHRK